MNYCIYVSILWSQSISLLVMYFISGKKRILSDSARLHLVIIHSLLVLHFYSFYWDMDRLFIIVLCLPVQCILNVWGKRSRMTLILNNCNIKNTLTEQLRENKIESILLRKSLTNNNHPTSCKGGLIGLEGGETVMKIELMKLMSKGSLMNSAKLIYLLRKKKLSRKISKTRRKSMSRLELLPIKKD